MIPSRSGWVTRALPTTRPLPVSRFSVPGGRPACWRISATSTPDSGVSEDGLATTVLPVTSAAAMGAPSRA